MKNQHHDNLPHTRPSKIQYTQCHKTYSDTLRINSLCEAREFHQLKEIFFPIHFIGGRTIYSNGFLFSHF